MKKKSKNNKKFIYAVGRRKQAVARVRLFRGKGKTVVNNKPIDEYFPGEEMKVAYEKPFELTNFQGYATIRVSGGGKRGQLGAVVHGLSRALAKLDREKFRGPLKKAGLLTRDARVRQRRMVGTGGKARRKKQSPKR